MDSAGRALDHSVAGTHRLTKRYAVVAAWALLELLLPAFGGAARSGGPQLEFGSGLEGSVQQTSMVRILADPSRFEGRSVGVIGVLYVEPAGEVLCLSREAESLGIYENCLCLEIDYQDLGLSMKQLSAISGDYVLLDGVLRSKAAGGCAATLEPVGRLMLWELTIELGKRSVSPTGETAKDANRAREAPKQDPPGEGSKDPSSEDEPPPGAALGAPGSIPSD